MHSRLCSRNKRAAYGSPIDILQNGKKVGFEIIYKKSDLSIKIATMDAGFRIFHWCSDFGEVDLKYDVIELKSTGDDDVCITELYINNKKIMTGRNEDQQRRVSPKLKL